VAAWVYILKCADGSYYTGLTTNFEQRMQQHYESRTSYVAARKPFECVYAAEFQSIRDAIDWERRLKRWSRAKKEAVIAGRFDSLPGLSRSYQHHGKPRDGASFDTPAMRAAQDD
jgi:putative endonuclease